jgi:dTDP-glucose 4,6-dehydratase
MIDAAPLSRAISQEDLEEVSRAIASSMVMWHGARILVTGATGFFGSWLLETFHHANNVLGLNATLVGVGAPNDSFAAKCPHLLNLNDVRLIKADICQLRQEIRGQLPAWYQRTDAVIHAAIHVDSQNYDRQPLPTLETAVKGTWEALEFARNAGAQRVLFVSSGAVYGVQPPTTTNIEEDGGSNVDCANHQSAYAEGKRIGETLCVSYLRQYDVPVTIARPFAFVGPHLPVDRQFAIGNFIRDALAGGPIVVQGDGKPLRSYLYASDLAIWLWTILARGTPGRPYNVGAENSISIRGIAELVARTAAPDVKVEILGEPQPGPPPRYVPSTARARRELGLAETVALAGAVRRTLEWHMQTPR